MPRFPIVDAHVHLWDLMKIDYPWLKDIPMLNRTFLVEDYDKACEDVKVEKIIFMQCECDFSQYQQEVDWVTEIAADEPRIRGIVSWAPMEKGHAVIPNLERLANNKLVKGIRRIIQFEVDPAFCLRPDFIAGVRLLPQFNFTFDICISHGQMKNTIKFIDRCPEVKFILDHIGKPDIKAHRLEPWRHGIMEMARYPNVYCKVSSLATEADHKNWTVEDLRPYAETVFEFFGFDRVVYAGDWPVSSQAATIPVCIRTLETILGEQPESILRKLFHENAVKFYDV